MKERLNSFACSISVSVLQLAATAEAKEKYCQEYSQAKQCFSEKRYKAALPLLNEAIKKNPKEAVYFRDRGHAYYKLDAKEEALADFQTALRLDPDIKLATKSVALCYLSLSKYADAINDYSKSIAINPSTGVQY